MTNILLGALIGLPLLGFILNFFFGKNMPKSLVGIIGSGTILLCFVISVIFFSNVLSSEVQSSVHTFFNWIRVGEFNIDFSFLVDRLSVMMLLIITGIGFLIHLYSIGYMHDDANYHRYFSYLNLFVFFMQILVLGGSYLITFIGWEGVGLCSYLLIGFWYKNQSYNNAAKKAFIMNRIGDLGLLLGIFLIYNIFGTINYLEVFGQAGKFELDDIIVISITLLLFVGAIGKSAQLPLYTWLPDAMAGPTPVSALIHAATMVTAGIFLIVRSHILFSLAPFTLEIITWIGLATALFAATIGLAQNDIKKVLAYSTVSQLGFMFVALGVGAYSTAMFHLTTHAFFKALLFLGAGSVIHGMSGEQDIRFMGGLRKKMPITFITFLIGTAAISGIPLLSGFFSKDEIMAKAFEHGPAIWVILLVTASITALYMFRLLFLTFYGQFRGTEEQRHHLHESPSTMTIPLMVLAVLSAIGGFIGLPHFLGVPHALDNYLHPILADLDTLGHHAAHLSVSTELILMTITTAMVFVMLFIARSRFIKSDAKEIPAESEQTGFMRVLANKYYVDEIYEFLIVNPLHFFSGIMHRFVDNGLIDGVVNGVGILVTRTGQYVRYVQTGNIGFYIFAMVAGIIVLLLVNIFLVR
ncbi:MAG: NADH-quinone oxidoreductase subunit L [Bacteroidia bacterium]